MHISRREFLRLTTISATGSLLAACRKRAPARSLAPATPTPLPDSAPGTVGEPPLLRARVAAGDLPPLEERLPANPLVLEPHESPGAYGGALRRGFVLETGTIYQDMRHGRPGQYTTPFFFQGLTSYTPELRLRPNLCETWEVSDDARTFTYHLRKGLRWSDGQPVTSSDARFYYERVVTHPRLGPVLSGPAPGVPVLVTPDDFTVEFHFSAPNPLHPYEMTGELPLQPAHYLSQWHGDLADGAALDSAAQAQGLRSWAGLYLLKSFWASNPELPVLHTWIPAGDTRGTEIVLERNPFFFQVDPQGRQLPYLDHLTLVRYDRPAALCEAAMRGEIDLQAEELTVEDIAALEEAAQSGHQALHLMPGSWHVALEPNLAYQEEPLRTFLGDRRVREALALAMDRETVNTLCCEGRCKPRQYSPVRASPYYDEALANSNLAYDPARAAALLDEAGYALRDAEGWRTGSDGQRLAVQLITTSGEGSPADRAAELVAGFLKDVGVACTVERLAYLDFVCRALANRVHVCLTERDHALLPIVSEYERLFRTVGDVRDQWAGGYLHYRLYGTEHPDYTAIEPPEGHWIREYWALWDQIAVEADERRRDALYAEVLELRRREIPIIGLLGEAAQPLVVAQGLRNLRTDLPYDLQTGGLALLAPQQLYWEAPGPHALATAGAETPAPQE